MAGRDDIQIDVPELLRTSHRARDTVVTALMWGVYIYLWVPMLSLVAWLLGIEFAYDAMVRAGGGRALVAVLFAYSMILGVIFLTVTLWSLGNRLRFRHAERRRGAGRVTDAETCEHFGLSLEQLATLREAQRVVVVLDETGGLAGFEATEPASQ